MARNCLPSLGDLRMTILIFLRDNSGETTREILATLDSGRDLMHGFQCQHPPAEIECFQSNKRCDYPRHQRPFGEADQFKSSFCVLPQRDSLKALS